MTTGAISRSVDSELPTRAAPRGLGGACAIGVTIFALVLLLPGTAGKGPEMDEGAVVAYSARVLDGAVPHRDFLTFYGPGNLWLIAGSFEVFGSSVGAERAVGLLYRILIVLSLFALARRMAGLVAAVLAGLLAASIMAEELIWAYATYGAIAFGLVGLALAAWGASSATRRQTLLLFSAGAAGGVAVLMRLDFAPAVVVSVLPLLLFVPARSRMWYGVGLLATAVLYVPHLVIVGPERVSRVVSDLIAGGPGRRLPIPRPWVYPGSLLLASILVTALLVLLGVVLWRRGPRDLTGRVLLSTGLFSVGVLPWTLSRAEVFHIRPFALVPLSLLPAVALLLARSVGVSSRVRTALGVVIVVVSLLGVLNARQHALHGFSELRGIQHAYRGFYDDDSGAGAVVARAGRLARTGDSLFVGPQDLRRTNYGPTYMYFLLPQLRPASYYMEMNPLTANREGSGLAGELRRADWLILTSAWDDWNEPNESSKLGSSEPNDVVRSKFCLRSESGEYRLYERCRRV